MGGRAMAYLDWNPAFDTGVPGIDYEHRRLVAMLNEINESILNELEPDRIADTLGAFHALAAAHFALEEKIMRDEKYAGLQDRQRVHYQLLDEVRDIMDAYEDGSFRAGQSLPETLKQWLGKAMDIDVDLFGRMSEAGLRQSGLSRS